MTHLWRKQVRSDNTSPWPTNDFMFTVIARGLSLADSSASDIYKAAVTIQHAAKVTLVKCLRLAQAKPFPLHQSCYWDHQGDIEFAWLISMERGFSMEHWTFWKGRLRHMQVN